MGLPVENRTSGHPSQIPRDYQSNLVNKSEISDICQFLGRWKVRNWLIPLRGPSVVCKIFYASYLKKLE